MNLTKIKLYGILLTFFVGTNAFAGAEGKGGGDVFICNGRVYLADTYKFMTSSPKELESIVAGYKLHDLLKFVALQLNRPVQALDVIQDKIERLKFRSTREDLPDLADDGIPSVPPECTKKLQLAIQDIDSGIVHYNKALYKSLTSIERKYFKIHEAVVALRAFFGMDTSTTKEVQTLLAHSAQLILESQQPFARPWYGAGQFLRKDEKWVQRCRELMQAKLGRVFVPQFIQCLIFSRAGLDYGQGYLNIDESEHSLRVLDLYNMYVMPKQTLKDKFFDTTANLSARNLADVWNIIFKIQSPRASSICKRPDPLKTAAEVNFCYSIIDKLNRKLFWYANSESIETTVNMLFLQTLIAEQDLPSN